MAGWASAIAGISFVRDDVTLDEQAGFVCPTASRAFLSVPVVREGRVAALLNAGRLGPVPFDADTVDVAEIFANQVGAAMANASLYHALATNIARLSLIADSITELVAVLDRNAMIQHASPPLAAAIGMNPEDLVGKNAVDLCHDEDKVRLLASVRDPRAEPTVRFRLRARSGDWVPLECRRSAGTTPAGEVVLIGRIVGPSD
jgi:PAS domain S-box-containing protein